MSECTHPEPATGPCFSCEAEAVVYVNDQGACIEHVDKIFGEAADALKVLYAAAEEAFKPHDR